MKNLLVALVALTALTGCVREIEIENLPARITSVGPFAVDDLQNVVIQFTLRDAEGDDQIVGLDICDSVDDGCGPAAQGYGGDPLERVPTVPAGTDVLHEFVWQPWCGRWIDQALLPTAVDDEFVVAVWVLSTDSDPVYSEPSSLAALGASEGVCD